ncbi:MAG: hypothetical protein R6V50_03050 [Thermoplasmatota archaeon]
MIHKTKLIVLVLIVFNIVIAGVLLLDFRVFTPPKTTVYINIAEVNANEVVLETTVIIENDNNFDIIINDFEVTSKTKTGVELGQIVIQGGIIEPKHSKTFNSLDNFILEDEDITVLENTLTAVVGFRFFGVLQKTLPLEIYIITSLDAVFEQLQQPSITMHADIIEINKQGLLFSTTIQIYNPTDLAYSIEEMMLSVVDEDNLLVGTLVFEHTSIEPKKTISLYSEGYLLFDALDAHTLYLKLDGIAGIKIAGLYKNISLSSDMSMGVPDIKTLIFGNNTIDFILDAQFKFTLRGINCYFGFQLYNPSNITIIAENLLCSVLRLDGDTYTLLGENIMEKCIALPEHTGCVKTNITIAYIHYLRSIQKKIRPDYIVLRIEGELYIAGTRQSVPISLNANISPYVIFTPQNIN